MMVCWLTSITLLGFIVGGFAAWASVMLGWGRWGAVLLALVGWVTFLMPVVFYTVPA